MANVRLSEEHIEAAMQACCRAVGVSSLKTKQKEAISSFLKGRDVFVCLPTGYGKSLCFVLLPLVCMCDYLRGQKNGSIVICVSPLTSLMMEQKAKYTHYGLSVEFVGELQYDLQSIQNVKEGKVQLLYISPESILRNPQWREMLLSDTYQANLVAVVVDSV